LAAEPKVFPDFLLTILSILAYKDKESVKELKEIDLYSTFSIEVEAKYSFVTAVLPVPALPMKHTD
jgi:hypothetical protein